MDSSVSLELRIQHHDLVTRLIIELSKHLIPYPLLLNAD